MVIPLFRPVDVAVLAGDAGAGEATGGTLRYLLARPVGRTRLLVAKLVALTVFVLLALAAVVGTSYVAGVLLLGTQPPAALGEPGGGTSLFGPPLTSTQLTVRVIGTVALITVSLLGVRAIWLFLSTLTVTA